MKLETMYYEKAGRIGYLTLNRPQILNFSHSLRPHFFPRQKACVCSSTVRVL
jgi:hypothetical protein